MAKCKEFRDVSLEDIIESAVAATNSSVMLRADNDSYNSLEQVFVHYISHCKPSLWKDLFLSSKTIAYFIKYVDAEDLNFAFKEFFDINANNSWLKHHLLKVSRLLWDPTIVSTNDFLELFLSSSSFNF